MAIQSQNTKLNVVPGGIIPVVNVSQYDVGRTLKFILYDGNSPASLASGTTVTIEGTKPSQKAFTYNASISGNEVTVNTQKQMTFEVGSVECKLVLTNGNQVIGTALFIMQVERGGVADDADISESVLPVYMEAGHQYMLGAEAWAVGTKDGVAVGSGEPQYHNNSKYWNQQTQTIANESEAWAKGTKNGTSVASSDPQYHNNSKYYSQQSANSATASANSAATAEARVNNAVRDAETMLNNAVRTATAQAGQYATNAENSATQAKGYRDQADRNAQLALQYAEDGREWAKSWAVYSSNTDLYGNDRNNSQYWSDRSKYWQEKTTTLYNKMQEKIDALMAIIKLLISTIYIVTESGDNIVTASGDRLVLDFAGSNYLTTEDGYTLQTDRGNNITISR